MRLVNRVTLSTLVAAAFAAFAAAAPPTATLASAAPPEPSSDGIPVLVLSAPAPQVNVAPPPAAPAPAPPPHLCPNGACPTVSCDQGNCCWCSGCDCCELCGRVIGGAGLYVVQPFFSDNPAIAFHVQGTGPGRRQDISEHMEVAPLVWLGYEDESGLGVRARWWYFREGTGQEFHVPAPDSGTLAVISAQPLGSFVFRDAPVDFAVTSKLQLQVADLEAFQETEFCRWKLLFAGGIGYADISQNYAAYATGSPPGGAADLVFAPRRLDPVLSGSSFVGVGPVIALEARRPLFNSGLSLYGSTRTRILFGSFKQTVFGGDELNGSVESRHDRVVTAEELEVGLEYGRRVRDSRVFGQVAMVGQEWFGAGNASGSTRTSPGTTIPNFSTEDSANLGLFGVVFRIGVEF